MSWEDLIIFVRYNLIKKIVYLKSSSERAPGDLVDLGGPMRPPAGEDGRAAGLEGGNGAARSDKSEFSTSRPPL